MQTRSRGDYTIAGRELIAEGTDLRVQVLTLAAGQCVPWHYQILFPPPASLVRTRFSGTTSKRSASGQGGPRPLMRLAGRF